jgi:AbrB family looped-hinge helix DNA binding protein
MKATGIVRRIDDLGRVVIPREIRRSMGVTEGDPIEMFIDSESGGLVLIPYHSEASDKIHAIAENLDTVGATPEHWAIAKELKDIAKKLEKLQ